MLNYDLLGILFFIFLAHIFIHKVKALFNAYNELEIIHHKPNANINNINIVSRFEEIGKFNDIPINKYVLLDDGKHFEFESVAILLNNGVYSADEPDKLHIMVDDKLLYKYIGN